MKQQGDISAEPFFPTRETFQDFAGRQREFVIDLVPPMLNGYFLRAREVTNSELDEGYQFATYSPVAPFIALGMLRGKIREGLATRYLSREHGTLSLGHNKLKGRVGYEGIVVDGEFISFEMFCAILDAYEGFNISLEISDPYD